MVAYGFDHVSFLESIVAWTVQLEISGDAVASPWRGKRLMMLAG